MKLKLYKAKISVEKKSLDDDLQRDLLSRDTAFGTKALIYIFLYKSESIDNPLRDLPYYKREVEARYRAFGSYDYVLPEDWTTDILNTAAAYPISDQEKDLYTYTKKMDELDTLLHDTKPKIKKNTSTTSGIVSYTTNIKIINSILKDITNIIQAKASLVSMYTQGSIPKHLRGGLSPLAKQKLKVTL